MPKPTSFFSQGARLAGSIWSSAKGRAPAVIVTGSWTTVKEQMPANYAPLLADAGYVVLTFDFRGFGGSEGEPRDVESARSKAEDVRNAVAFLRTHPAVDPDRIGAVPICASAGYVAAAMIAEPQLKSVAMIAPWLHDAEIVRTTYGGHDAVKQRIEQALAARERYAESAEVAYVPAASSTDASAAMHMPADVLDYYLNPRRGAISEWSGRFAVLAWKEWLEFDPIALAPRITAPVRLVTGKQTATPAGATKFEAGLHAPHDSVWLEGTQFDFYDKPETVAAAAQHAIAHLRSTL
ncbi:MAG: alpha/beta fold hydrolase [Gemmatimonadaceae bacterium]